MLVSLALHQIWTRWRFFYDGLTATLIIHDSVHFKNCINSSCSFILCDHCFFSALFLVLMVQRPLSGHSSSIFILASQSTTRFFVFFAVCQPDCFPCHVLLLHVCAPCWWLRRNQSNSVRWQVEHNLTCFSRCVPVSRMYVWTNRLVNMRWCSYVYVRLGERGSLALTRGSSIVREPLNWRTRTQALKSGKRWSGVRSQSKGRANSHIITFPAAICQLTHYRSAWNLTHRAFHWLGSEPLSV